MVDGRLSYGRKERTIAPAHEPGVLFKNSESRAQSTLVNHSDFTGTSDTLPLYKQQASGMPATGFRSA